MSVNAPIASADCRTKREVIRTDGFVTFIRFTVRAREGIATLPLGGRWGTGVSRTLILLGPIRWWLVSYGDGAARSGRGACRATSSSSVFILESRHTRTADGPGKAGPGHAMGKQFNKLTRVSNAKRWPEQLET
jgi:hypothetical protein